jgi:hypothetical protein
MESNQINDIEVKDFEIVSPSTNNLKTKNIMKKLLVIAVLLQGLFSNAQEYIVAHSIDEMTKKEYYLPTEKMIIANKEKTEGFTMSPNFRFENNKLILQSLIVKSFVGSSCVENSKLYFLLENDKVIILESWNKFNCDGTSYFDFSDEDLQSLSESKIKLVRFVNGYKFAEFQNNPTTNDKNFLIRVITNSKIVESK